MACALAAAGRAGASTSAAVDSVAPAPPRDASNALACPSLVQINAPSINSASPDLVDHAAFPTLAGVAWDERLEPGPNDRAITVNVTPLALARAVRREDGGLAENTELAEELSRVSARVTLGGPLQDVPRKGRAGRPTNHVTSELKMILLGDGALDRGASHAALLALALAADNLATGYGLDRYAATLIAEREGACTWTANAGYRVVERYHTPTRREETKLATGAQWRMFGSVEHPIELGLSGACLLRNHGAADWQDGARLDVPIRGGLWLSAALRRSHRPELPGQDTMREVLSLAYGAGGLER
jgi:hypothetical protein